MLLTSDSRADLEQCESIWNFVDGLWKIHKKCPSLKGWARCLWGALRVFNKNSAGVELPLWKLSHSPTRPDGGLDLAKEDKGTPPGGWLF